jgi:hypothetical protein
MMFAKGARKYRWHNNGKEIRSNLGKYSGMGVLLGGGTYHGFFSTNIFFILKLH